MGIRSDGAWPSSRKTHERSQRQNEHSGYTGEMYSSKGRSVARKDSMHTPNYYTSNTSHNAIKAAKGYHGIVRKPTYFLAGEKGPERVNISPQKKHHNHKKSFLDFF